MFKRLISTVFAYALLINGAVNAQNLDLNTFATLSHEETDKIFYDAKTALDKAVATEGAIQGLNSEEIAQLQKEVAAKVDNKIAALNPSTNKEKKFVWAVVGAAVALGGVAAYVWVLPTIKEWFSGDDKSKSGKDDDKDCDDKECPKKKKGNKKNAKAEDKKDAKKDDKKDNKKNKKNAKKDDKKTAAAKKVAADKKKGKGGKPAAEESEDEDDAASDDESAASDDESEKAKESDNDEDGDEDNDDETEEEEAPAKGAKKKAAAKKPAAKRVTRSAKK